MNFVLVSLACLFVCMFVSLNSRWWCWIWKKKGQWWILLLWEM